MYCIHLRGQKKAVYMVRNNLLGYGLPEIQFEEGTDDSYIMHCELATEHDAVPNQHAFGSAKEVWDGKTIDLSSVSWDDILSGKYDGMYGHLELDILSGMFGIDIELLNDPDDKWWEDAECDPQYPFFAYSGGRETKCEYQEDDSLDVFSF